MTALRMSEADLQSTLMDTAKLFKWQCVHLRAVEHKGRWSVPYEGDEGLPDLILARAGRVILAELKSATGRVTPEQAAWLAAASGRTGGCGGPATSPPLSRSCGMGKREPHPLPAMVDTGFSGPPCLACGATHLRRYARGLCKTCYRRAARNERLAGFPLRWAEANREPAKRAASGRKRPGWRVDKAIPRAGSGERT